VVLAETKAICAYVPLVPVFLSTPKLLSLVELSCQVKVSCAGGVTTVKEALATALGLEPLLNAMAFTVALLVRVIVPVYRVDDCVGIEPSVV
jgi:hypothetical protein